MIDVREPSNNRSRFVSVEFVKRLHSDMPDGLVRSCFAREVAGFEFCERGVDVIDVELNGRRNPLVGVNLGDVENLCDDIVAAPRETDTIQGESLPSGRND